LILRTGPGQILAALSNCYWPFLSAAAVLFAGGQIWRGAKWAYLLDGARPGTAHRVPIGCYLTNAFLSNVTPGRAGEAAGPLLLVSRCGTSKSLALAVVVVDRSLDLLALLTFMAVTSVYLGIRSDSEIGFYLGLFAGTALIVFFLLARFLVLSPSAVDDDYGVSDSSKRSRFPLRLISFLRQTRRMVTHVGRPERLKFVALMTVTAWLVDFLSYYLMINAFTPIRFLDNAACQTVAAGAALLSLVPGGLGVSTVSHVLVAQSLGYSWRGVAAGSVVNVFMTHSVRFVLAALSVVLRDREPSTEPR